MKERRCKREKACGKEIELELGLKVDKQEEEQKFEIVLLLEIED